LFCSCRFWTCFSRLASMWSMNRWMDGKKET
jgi:hypothetical protein